MVLVILPVRLADSPAASLSPGNIPPRGAVLPTHPRLLGPESRGYISVFRPAYPENPK